MQDSDVEEVQTKPLYIVQIKGHRGSCSIVFEDPARALKSMSDVLRHGFNEVRISNASGQTLSVEDMKRLSGQ